MAEHLVGFKISVTAESKATLDALCAKEGVTLGAMFEAYAEMLMAGAGEGQLYDAWITRAREITAMRRKRLHHQAG